MMQTGKKIGMRIMDESILELMNNEEISGEVALQYVENQAPVKAYLEKNSASSGRRRGSNRSCFSNNDITVLSDGF